MPPCDFSIVITTYNRPRQLAAALRAIAALDYPRDAFEVIIVDDGGAEPLDLLVAPHAATLDIRLLRQPNGGPAAGRNTGAAAARGRWLAFVDDDCEPAPAWLQAMKRAAESHPGALLGGHTINGLPHSVCSEASQLLIDLVYRFYNADPLNARFFASNNMVVPLDGFRAVNGFGLQFRHAAGEDRDLCERWHAAGRPLVYVPAAVVAHLRPMVLSGFLRQHFQYGRGAAQFHRLNYTSAAAGLKRHGGMHRHWRAWLAKPWESSSGLRALALLLLLFASQAANVAGLCYGLAFDPDPRR